MISSFLRLIGARAVSGASCFRAARPRGHHRLVSCEIGQSPSSTSNRLKFLIFSNQTTLGRSRLLALSEGILCCTIRGLSVTVRNDDLGYALENVG